MLIKFFFKIIIVFSLISPNYTFANMSEIRLKTLLNICEAAQSNGDSGTTISIARQLKVIKLNTKSDLADKALQCIEAAFPSDTKSASHEDMIRKINDLQTELRTLCFDLLELKPISAITFEPCKEFY